ncbi:F0F1 ATP synthase subunit delta [Sulfuricystis multivorans]|uniref:F0F1 ATP synthase subunit delta n=1 Tax=Sulfuricystis multivorans TaxID=2211108 RepID=UPI000F831D75|nr:F0F1 ATP synthase subunit delta [Sulfuricystis multivorans]
MAENVTIARPYAEAAFELAKSAGALTAWQDALARLAVAARDPAMRECMADPRLSSATLTDLFLGVAGELTPEQCNFLSILVDNRRLDVLPEISALFDELKNAQEGTREALVTSAFPLTEAQLDKLVIDLERKFGCRIKASVQVDPELIGGVRIALGDQVIDASVRGKLNAMAVSLKN